MASFLFKSDGLDPAMPVTAQGEVWASLYKGSETPHYLWLINLFSLAPALRLDVATDLGRPSGELRPLVADAVGTLLAQEMDGPALDVTGRVYSITRNGAWQYTDEGGTGSARLSVAWRASDGSVWAESSGGDDRATVMSAFDYTAHTRADGMTDSFGAGELALFHRAGAIAGRVYASQRDPGELGRFGYFALDGSWTTLETFTGDGGGRGLVGSDGYLYIGCADAGSRDMIQKYDQDGILQAQSELPGADPDDTLITRMVLDAAGKLWVQGEGGGEVNAWRVNAGSMEVEVSGVVTDADMLPGQDFDGQAAAAVGTTPSTGRNRLALFQVDPALNPEDVDLGLDVVRPLSLLAGLTEGELDVASLIGVPVAGYAITSRGSVREMIEPLMGVYLFDATESDDQVKYVLRGGSVVANIPEEEIGAAEGFPQESDEPLSLERRQEMELPLEVNLAYMRADGSYEVSQQPSRRLITEAVESITLSVPVVLTDERGKQVADTVMYSAWIERKTASFATSRAYQALEPTDPIIVNRGGTAHRLRVSKKTDGANGVIAFECAAEDPSVYEQFSSGVAPTPAPDPILQVLPVAPSVAELWDLPMLRDGDNNPGFYFGGYGTVPDGWRGLILYQSQDGGSSYSQLFNGDLLNPSTIGQASQPLPPPPDIFDLHEPGTFSEEACEAFDEVSALFVTLASGSLESRTREQLLQGGNAATVGDEVLQFRDTELIAPMQYRLRGLLRARLGTERAAGSHAAGERFMLLDESTMRMIGQAFAQLDQDYFYKPVTVGSTLQRTAAQPFVNTGERRRPLSPVRLSGGRNAGGDLLIKWKPRTRFNVRWALGVEMPSGETEEKYAVYIPSFADAVRVIQSATPSATYTAAMQSEDFGSPQPSVQCEVCQVSPELGLGHFTQGEF